MSFVHLHLHSEYSLLDGACRISDIPKKARAEGHSAVALTDHGVMYGAVAFYNACKAEGVKPIIGCEVYVAPRTRFDKVYAKDSEACHLVLLCKNAEGYKNLIKMVSDSFTEGFYIKPRIDKDLLRAHSTGLIALSGCLAGKIPRLIEGGFISEAKAEALELAEIFGTGNFYLEIQDHGIEAQKRVNAVIKSISEETKIPMVATNDVHYLDKKDADTQAVMMCIQTNSKITDGRPIGFDTDEFYYKSTEEMEKLFSAYQGAVENSEIIAEKCNFDFTFGNYYLPAFETPDGSAPTNYLKHLAEKGLKTRCERGDIVFGDAHPETEYRERMEYELSVIIKMGYAEYYLIVHDFVGFAKDSGISVGPGRGSGAGSLVAYLLRITDIDPLKFGLIFERFLNPERISMPDFDIDFCYIRREEVIKYVTEKYGSDRVSQIITFGTMAARASIRDVVRAMGVSYSDGDALVRSMPKKFGTTLNEAEKHKPFAEIASSSATMRKIVDTAKSLEGMPRHSSTHAAGVIISDKPIYEYVPLALSGDIRVTQYDMDTVASLGLLKFDFLGLRYLTVIADAEKMVRRKLHDFNIETIPDRDPETFEMLKAGQTVGVFQLESAGMRSMLTSFRPECIADLMIAISVYRPGPMENIPKLIENRKRGNIEYDIPELAPILNSTYGCVIYQEQVMQIFRTLADYSYGQADVVRKAISKKKPDIIEKQRSAFLERSQKHISEEKAAKLFDDIVGFAGYAFNKSHAAAYAVLAYRTAYLKAHYPAEFLASLMTSVLGNQSALSEYMAEASRLGIKILPPSVNESYMDFSTSGDSIRYGLSALKNIGVGFVNRLLDERRNGSFKNLPDFTERLYGRELSRKQLEVLIKSGAFDCFGVYRSRLLEKLDDILSKVTEKKKESVTGQLSLFSGENADDTDRTEYSDIPEFPLRVLLNLEREASGMYFSGHLTDEYSNNAKDIETVPIGSILASFDENSEENEFSESQLVPIYGVISSKNVKNTKNGEPMAFLNLEDRSGEIEVIVFPKLYNEFLPLLSTDAVVAIYGEISLKDDEPKIILRSAAPMRTNDKYTSRPSPFSNLAKATEKPKVSYTPATADNPLPIQNSPEIHPSKIYLRVSTVGSKEALKAINLIEIFEGDVPVIFFESETGKYTSRKDLLLDATPFVINQLKNILGNDNVVVK